MKSRNLVARLLIAAMTGMAISPHAYSSSISTTDAASNRERILVLLDRRDVKEQLKAHGVKPSDAKARIAALTDQEVAQLAASMDRAPAGGNGDAAGAVVYGLMVLGGLILVGIFWIIVKAGEAVAKGVTSGPDKTPAKHGPAADDVNP